MNSWLPGMLDAVLQATFLCALLMFWLCIYHGLRQNERRFVSFYLVKIIVVLPIWLCAIVLATWEKCNELRDPTYSHFVDTKNYNVSSISQTKSFAHPFACRASRCSSTLPAACMCSTWVCFCCAPTRNCVPCLTLVS